MSLHFLTINRQRRRHGFKDDLPGKNLYSAKLDILILYRFPDDGNDGIQGNGIYCCIQCLIFPFFYRHLYLAGNVLENDERHLLLVADALHESLNLDLLRITYL